MSLLLQWVFFIATPFLSAWAALFVWARFEIMSYALIAGTLAGVAVGLAISMLFWSGESACDYCYAEQGQ